MHHATLISTIATGFALAFALGYIADRLRLPPLVGYLLAGVLVGPFTPGFVADGELSVQLAEVGIILLMFGVGLHFSAADLLAVRRLAVPGAILQIVLATALGIGLCRLWGWPLGTGLVVGLSLSVASTVVLLKALEERNLLESPNGRVAVGWLIVEDLAMVLALVLLPAFAEMLGGHATGPHDINHASDRPVLLELAITLAKVGAFAATALILGPRIVPWILARVARTGSRELFRLAVYAIALGVAYGAAKMFGVSFALGAFFAGMVLGESDLSQRATEEAMPLRDAFAVLFFVSVGMLLNPLVFIEQPFAVLGVVAIIVVGKSAAAYGIVRAFTVAGSLAQIGEFSFILIGLGIELDMVPKDSRDLVLAGAILSILINPFLFGLMERARRPSIEPAAVDIQPAEAAAPPTTELHGHDVLVGYGRVGSLIGEGLVRGGAKLLVIEASDEGRDKARSDGIPVIVGNAAAPGFLEAANIAGARRLFVTVPEAFEAGQVVQQARAANPDLDIVARAHSDAAVDHLKSLGANVIVMGEQEIAQRMIEHARTSS